MVAPTITTTTPLAREVWDRIHFLIAEDAQDPAAVRSWLNKDRLRPVLLPTGVFRLITPSGLFQDTIRKRWGDDIRIILYGALGYPVKVEITVEDRELTQWLQTSATERQGRTTLLAAGIPIHYHERCLRTAGQQVENGRTLQSAVMDGAITPGEARQLVEVEAARDFANTLSFGVVGVMPGRWHRDVPWDLRLPIVRAILRQLVRKDRQCIRDLERRVSVWLQESCDLALHLEREGCSEREIHARLKARYQAQRQARQEVA